MYDPGLMNPRGGHEPGDTNSKEVGSGAHETASGANRGRWSGAECEPRVSIRRRSGPGFISGDIQKRLS